MTEDEAEIVFDRYEDISAAVHYVVDQMTKELPLEMDVAVRNRLNDEFRFWRVHQKATGGEGTYHGS